MAPTNRTNANLNPILNPNPCLIPNPDPDPDPDPDPGPNLVLLPKNQRRMRLRVRVSLACRTVRVSAAAVLADVVPMAVTRTVVSLMQHNKESGCAMKGSS